MTAKENKASFFKQSGWLVIATVGGGVFMSGVHPLVTVAGMPDGEYNLFNSLLRVFLLLGIPAGGLQTIFAQYAAAALDDTHHRQLASMTRRVLGATFAVWLVMGGVMLAASAGIKDALHITNSPAFVFTLLIGLPALWIPMLKGLLQGRQHFAGFGWLLILDGVGRFGSILVLVAWFGGQSGGAMAGAFLGQAVAVTVGAWFTRDIWMGAGARVEWRPWIKKVIPLTFASAALLVVTNVDGPFVRNTFAENQAEMKDLYSAAAMIGTALAQFTTPLALVMFPKIARSKARAEKTDAMAVALLGTVVLGGLAALASTLLPELPLRIVFFTNPAKYVHAAPLVPWFAWCMLTLTLAGVLINNLLARERYEVVPWLVAIAAAYALTLLGLRPVLLNMPTLDALRTIVQVLFGANLLLLLVSMRFNWSKPSTARP